MSSILKHAGHYLVRRYVPSSGRAGVRSEFAHINAPEVFHVTARAAIKAAAHLPALPHKRMAALISSAGLSHSQRAELQTGTGKLLPPGYIMVFGKLRKIGAGKKR